MSKNPITVYWSSHVIATNGENDWSLLYPKPKTLLSEMISDKSKEEYAHSFKSDTSYLACPAVNSRFKNTYVFKNELASSYRYNFENGQSNFDPIGKNALGYTLTHPPTIGSKPLVEFALGYMFFADEPLNVLLSAPFFHQSKYTKYGSIVPGEFDIGQWFRPYFFEVQMWDSKGEFHVEANESIFYASFLTNRNIELKRFNYTNNLSSYSGALIEGNRLFGKGQSLLSRYNRFASVGMREKILTEINKNLID